MCIGSVKLIVAQTKVTLAYKLVGDLCILLTLISFKFDIHVFGILSGNDIQIQIGEDGILSLPSQGLKLRKYFRGQVGPHQINFGSPHNLLGAHQVRIARLPPRLQGALWRGVR